MKTRKFLFRKKRLKLDFYEIVQCFWYVTIIFLILTNKASSHCIYIDFEDFIKPHLVRSKWIVGIRLFTLSNERTNCSSTFIYVGLLS